MKKAILIIMLLLAMAVFCSCNYVLFDTTYEYDRAQIMLPDGSVVSGKVQKWSDYEGDQLQICIDGVTYLAHAENVVMIAE